jgi:RNA polymerase sigma factor (sigma-70 family)
MASPLLTGVLRYIRALATPTGSGDRSDAELLRRFVGRRDEGAFAALLERHGPMVLGVCRQVLGDIHDAEDAFQATFLVLARKAPSIRRRESLAVWLHRVALNIARTASADAARRRAQERGSVVRAPTRPVADDVALREWQLLVHAEVDRLPEKYRVPVVLCYFEGKSHDEAAHQLGWPLGTVKGRLARARQLLQIRLVRRGLTLTAAGITTLAQGTSVVAVPPALMAPTLRAALQFATGGAVPGASASANALALAKGAVQAMTGTMATRLAALLLAVGLIASLVAATAPRTQRGATPPEQAEARPQRRDRHGDPLPPGALARLGTVRFRYGSQFAFSPDGKTLAAISYLPPATIHLLDVDTGKELHQFQGPPGGFFGSPAFSPDGKRLAATDGTGTLYVWETATGKEDRRFPVPARIHLPARAFSPDGTALALLSWEGWIVLLDLTTGKERRKFVGHKNKVQSAAFAPDGRTLATANLDGTVRVWDVATGKELHRFLGDKGPVKAVSFSPDGKTLAAGGSLAEGMLYLWDAGSGKELRRFRATQGPGFSEAGWLSALAFSPDGKTLATASGEQVVRVWEVSTGREVRSFKGARALAFSPDGTLLAVSDPFGTSLCLWDVATRKEVNASEGHTSPVEVIAVSPDGTLLASGGKDGTIRLWQVGTGKHIRRLSGHTGAVTALVVSPDGRTVVSLSADFTIRTWEVSTGRELHRLVSEEADAFTSVALSPDGETLASGRLDGTIWLWEAATGKKVHQFQAHPSRVNPNDGLSYPAAVSLLAFSPSGKLLAAGIDGVRSGNEIFHLFDAHTGTPRHQLQVPPSEKDQDSCSHKQPSLAFSPDGRTLATGSGQKMLRVWEVASGKERYRLSGTKVAGIQGYTEAAAERWPYTLAHSPDGKTLASWGLHSETVRVWDAATGKELAQLRGHRGPVTAAAFLPGGEGLVSGSVDTTMLVWDVRTRRGVERPPAKALSATELETLWGDLLSDDAARAYRALSALAAAPTQVAPFFKDRLRPIPPVENQNLRQFIADLGSSRFAVRQKATDELERLGELAVPMLRKALADKPALEVRRRVEQLLARLEGQRMPPERLRALRAIEALERVGSEEAQQVLKQLAQGASGASVTDDAKEALARLTRRPMARP